MIIGCVIFYNDGVNLLERCLKSLSKVTDKIISIDGAYAEFPHDDFKSSEDCINLAKKYSDIFIPAEKEWVDQVEKRNRYLTEAFKIGKEGDYILLIDADESISGRKPNKLTEDIYSLRLSTNVDNSVLRVNLNRLFKLTEGLHYDGKHNILLNKNNELLSEYNINTPVYKFLEIQHTPEERSKERLEQDGEYLRNRGENNFAYSFPVHVNQTEEIEVDIKEILTRRMLKALQHYHGYDLDGTEIFLRVGDIVEISQEKALQLLNDFPLKFAEL